MAQATLAELQTRARLVAPMPGRAATVIALADLDHIEKVTPGPANVGNGTVGAVSAIDTIDVGRYELRCTTAVTNGGVFELVRPLSEPVGGLTLTVGAGVSTVFQTNGLYFKITDGPINFAVGDSFAFTPYPSDPVRVAALVADLNAGGRPGPIWLHTGSGAGSWGIENPDGFERLAAARKAGVANVIVWDYGGSVADHVARLQS